MNILVIAKRFYTGKDLLAERYGRVYELSAELAAAGHSIYGIALDYRRLADRGLDDIVDANLHWQTVSLFPNVIGGFRAYVKKIESTVLTKGIDIVLSVSDVFHVILGGRIAARYGLMHVADLYDNYESFSASRTPGATMLFRRALRRADGIVCVTESLAAHVRDKYGINARSQVITNAVNIEQFTPLDRAECRKKLGLPVDKRIVGYGGAIAANRGIQLVFQAHSEVMEHRPDTHLVLAGPVDRHVEIPSDGNVHYLGEIGYKAMPAFFGALDVGIISNLDSAFGRYCFPQKLFELLACNTPVVIASTGDLSNLMSGCTHALFEPGSTKGLVRAIGMQLDKPCMPDIEIPTWHRQGAILSDYLRSVFLSCRNGEAKEKH